MGKKLALLLCLIAVALPSIACTSAIISGRCTPDGRPLLWKNRDTGTLQNFIDREEPSQDGTMAFVALFNAGDSLRQQAWAGMNDASFAIMNTASYNLAPDTARVRDREGFVMAQALARCRTLADFETLLDTMPRPLGVQANFGVIDTEGKGAFYETCDTGYVRFLLDDSPSGVLIRTNFSVSGQTDGGYGYIRYDNAATLINPVAAGAKVTPTFLTDTVSCSFYHSLLGRDCLADTMRWAVDQDFIPRHSTSASVAITGKSSPADMREPVMHCALGYPPCAVTRTVTLRDIPQRLRPGSDGLAPDCVVAMSLKEKIFPVRRGSGPHYINMDALRRRLSEKLKP